MFDESAAMLSGEMRVLLIENDRELAEYVRRKLKEESLSVVVAHDRASGLRWPSHRLSTFLC